MIKKYGLHKRLSSYQQQHQHFIMQSLEIDITFSQLCIIDLVSNELRNIFSINLDHCKLQCLQGIEQFIRLQQISCRYNYLTKIQQLGKINNKILVIKTNIFGNPFIQNQTQIQSYLKKIFRNLKRINSHPILKQNFNKQTIYHSINTQLPILRKADSYRPVIQQPKTACFNQQKTIRYMAKGKDQQEQTTRIPKKSIEGYSNSKFSYSLQDIQNRQHLNNTSRISCCIDECQKGVLYIAMNFRKYKLFNGLRSVLCKVKKHQTRCKQILQYDQLQQQSAQQMSYLH